MLKSLLSLSRLGLLSWLGVCLSLPAAAGTPSAIPQPLLLPSYGYWINEADCVEEPAAAQPAMAVLAAAAPQPQPVAPPPPPAPPTWQLKASDQTLKTALLRWAASEGWQLVWEAPVDYAVERDTTVTGSFEQAIEAVAHSMAGAETPLQAIFYKGNRVIRIVVKGAQS
ncbi:toxin co-regulated pilus biosynthesis Q family protein [Duganella sp. CT11-25]|uniref:toxin co-regulated pilus biosynthesis Q family protein n=1 Tax=unclassified Duganella TaxID=2636909 RepID=UPI0039B08EF0